MKLTTLLTVLFIGLKLAGVISWSWLWVLSPTWIPLALVITFFAVVLAFPGGRKALREKVREDAQKRALNALVNTRGGSPERNRAVNSLMANLGKS
jgi:energy-coupling factor transporter transmembrane protein EcfT